MEAVSGQVGVVSFQLTGASGRLTGGGVGSQVGAVKNRRELSVDRWELLAGSRVLQLSGWSELTGEAFSCQVGAVK